MTVHSEERASMSEDELKELDRLLEHYGKITTRQALDALKEELKTQRERDPYWRFKQGHSSRRRGRRCGQVVTGSHRSVTVQPKYRASMSEAELKELDELKDTTARTSRLVRLWMR